MRVYNAGGALQKTIGCIGGTRFSDEFTLPATGTYTVTVDSCNTAYAGNYHLSFLNASTGPLRAGGDPAVEGGALVSARTIQATMSRGDIDAYQFRGDAGERVIFNAAEATTGPNLKMWLYPPATAPNPTVTLLSGGADRQEISLTHSGIYTLVLLGQDLDSYGDYLLTMQKLPGASADCYSLDYPDADGGVIPAAPTASSGTGSSIRHKTDLDPWQFHATAGQTATVALSRELRLALYAPQAPRGYGAPFFSYACGTAPDDPQRPPAGDRLL